MIVLGHEFQNFPSEPYKVFKMKSVPGQDNRNIVKWILSGKSRSHAPIQRQKTYQVPGGMLQGLHNPLQRQESLTVGGPNPQETHLMPGKYSIFSNF